MIYPSEMLDILQSAAVSVQATVYRHMFGSHPPARSNIVIYAQDPPADVFQVLSEEVIAPDER